LKQGEPQVWQRKREHALLLQNGVGLRRLKPRGSELFGASVIGYKT
jgi:hypothetical protein